MVNYPGILPVRGFPSYAVSSQGNVWSFKQKTPRKLKPGKERGGHLFVMLSVGGEAKHMLVHRLVLFAFVGPAPEGMECRHLNGDPQDNRLENLCWGTHSQNGLDAAKHGVLRTSRLTNEQIRQIRRMSGRRKDIATKFGISIPYVDNLRSGKNGDYSLGVRDR